MKLPSDAVCTVRSPSGAEVDDAPARKIVLDFPHMPLGTEVTLCDGRGASATFQSLDHATCRLEMARGTERVEFEEIATSAVLPEIVAF